MERSLAPVGSLAPRAKEDLIIRKGAVVAPGYSGLAHSNLSACARQEPS